MKFLKYVSGQFIETTRNSEARYVASKEPVASLGCFSGLNPGNQCLTGQKLTFFFFLLSLYLQRLFVLVYTGYIKKGGPQWTYFTMQFTSLKSLQTSLRHLMLSKTFCFRQNIIHLTLLTRFISATLFHQWLLSITICPFSLADLPLQCPMPSHI